MSAFGPKRTSLIALHMSAFGGKADYSRAAIRPTQQHVIPRNVEPDMRRVALEANP